ncbi:MAG: hypothetical protein ACRET1_07225 [Burkholderiales bacterium]
MSTSHRRGPIDVELKSPADASNGSGPRAVAPVNETYASGVSWAAVIGGAVVTAALALVLLALGAGLGLSSVSPWSRPSATAIGIGAIVWLIVMQIIASGIGGYLAGRLRTKWVHVHTDEVFFRDTAHGLLVWAVGVVVTAALLTSAASSLVGGGVRAGSSALSVAAGNATRAAGQLSILPGHGYFIDMLLRPNQPATQTGDAAVHAEVGRIFAAGIVRGTFTPEDKTYLARIVAARTGVGRDDAEKRVADVIARARAATEQAKTDARKTADDARKAAAYLSLWVFVSFLIGAFCASYAATIGGRQRDNVPV